MFGNVTVNKGVWTIDPIHISFKRLTVLTLYLYLVTSSKRFFFFFSFLFLAKEDSFKCLLVDFFFVFSSNTFLRLFSIPSFCRLIYKGIKLLCFHKYSSVVIVCRSAVLDVQIY